MTKSPFSANRTLNGDSHRRAKVENKQKISPIKSKSHVFGDSHLQPHERETKFSSSSSKKLKLASSPDKIAKLEKQKNVSASFSESDVNKLRNNKKAKCSGAEERSGDYADKKLDSMKSKAQLNGDQDSWKENGIVSFTDETEISDLFPSHQQTPISHVQQGAVYNEFESAVLDEYVDRKPAGNVGKFSSRRTDRDSSDEDVFDLIASGRINKVIWQSQGSRSNYSILRHQRNLSSASDAVYRNQMVSKRRTADAEGGDYDSASSADTDVIIRSHRLMSEVTANLRNQTVSSLQPNLSTTLNIADQSCNLGSQDQLSTITKNVSPSRGLAENSCSTERKRRRKRFSGDSTETAVNNSVSSPLVQQPTLIVDENIVQRALPENCRSAECKRKQKPSKAGDVKPAAKNADVLPVESPKTELLPITAAVNSSSVKQHKTDVSVVVSSNRMKVCIYSFHSYVDTVFVF